MQATPFNLVCILFIGFAFGVAVWILTGIFEVACEEPDQTPRDSMPRRIAFSQACTTGESRCGDQGEWPAASPLPAVSISREALDAIARTINRERSLHPGAETGVGLVGRFYGFGQSRRLVINGFVEAGPGHERSFGHVRFNRQWQQSRLNELQLLDPLASFIGDAHLHPGRMDHCSEGDYHTDRSNVLASATRELIFAIATDCPEGPAGHRQNRSLFAAGLKLDFFYLGHASQFRYARVLPAIVDDPMLHVSPALARLLALDPPRMRFDWICLRQLPQWRIRLDEIALGDVSALCLEMAHRQSDRTLLLVLRDPAEPPEVLVSQGPGETPVLFAPDFLKGPSARNILLTQIVFAFGCEIESHRTAGMAESISRPLPVAFSEEPIHG